MSFKEIVDMLATLAVAYGTRPLWAPLAYLSPRTWYWARILRTTPQQYAERAIFALRGKDGAMPRAWVVFAKAFLLMLEDDLQPVIEAKKPTREVYNVALKLDAVEFTEALKTIRKNVEESLDAREGQLNAREAELQGLVDALGLNNDPNPLPDNKRGLYDKYLVINRATGKPVEGECFVLRPGKDWAAREALLTYARLCSNSQLAEDLIAWRKLMPPIITAFGGDNQEFDIVADAAEQRNG